MPKVSKLVSLKLEKHFNDARAEKNFVTSGEFKLKSESPVNQMAKIKQEYFASLIDIEKEKKKYYLKKYNAAVRENQRKFLEEVEGFLSGDEKSKASCNRRSARDDVEETDSASKADDKTTAVSDVDNEDENCLALNLDSKSEAGKSAVSKKTRMTILSSARSRSRILPEISVPISEGGKIKPKLKDSPKRKTTFLEAERVVRDANDVYAQASMQEINNIYKYRVRDHSLKTPQKVKEEFNKRDHARRFHVHLHAGTILKAPKLCADVGKILNMNEKRSLENEDNQVHDDEKVFVSEGSINLLPKGEGVLKHLPVLLGVEVESLTEEDADEYDGDKESAEVVIELEGGDHEHTKLEESEDEAGSAQSSEEATEERWDADVDGATISSADGKPAIKHRKFASKKERNEKHVMRRHSESSSSDEETVTETGTMETKSVTPLTFKRVESSSSEMSKQVPHSNLADEVSVSQAADDKRSDTDAINQVEQFQGYADHDSGEKDSRKAESTISGSQGLLGSVVSQLKEDESTEGLDERRDAQKEALLEDSASETEAPVTKSEQTLELASDINKESALEETSQKSDGAIVREDNTDDFFDDPVVKEDPEPKMEDENKPGSSITDDLKIEGAPTEENEQVSSAVIKYQETQQMEHVMQLSVNDDEKPTQQFDPETERQSEADNEIAPVINSAEEPVSVENKVESDDQREAPEKVSNDQPLDVSFGGNQVEAKDSSGSQEKSAEEKSKEEYVDTNDEATEKPKESLLKDQSLVEQTTGLEDKSVESNAEKVSSEIEKTENDDKTSNQIQVDENNSHVDIGATAADKVPESDNAITEEKAEEGNLSHGHEPTEEPVELLSDQTVANVGNEPEAVGVGSEDNHPPVDAPHKSETNESPISNSNNDSNERADSLQNIEINGELSEGVKQEDAVVEEASAEADIESKTESQTQVEGACDEKLKDVSINDQPNADADQLEVAVGPNDIDNPIQDPVPQADASAAPASEIAVTDATVEKYEVDGTDHKEEETSA